MVTGGHAAGMIMKNGGGRLLRPIVSVGLIGFSKFSRVSRVIVKVAKQYTCIVTKQYMIIRFRFDTVS